MQKTITTLVGAIKLMLERIPEPPDANCSCHISPPCNDCVDYAGAREAFEYAKGVLAEVQSDARHGVDSLAPQLELERGTLLAETERKQQLQGQVDALLAALGCIMQMDVKGHALQDRLQFSPAGRAILEQCQAAIAAAQPATVKDSLTTEPQARLVNPQLLTALSKISRMTMSMYASAGEAMSEAKRIAHEAIAAAEQAQQGKTVTLEQLVANLKAGEDGDAISAAMDQAAADMELGRRMREQAQHSFWAQPRCACGDGFTSDAVCANCLAAAEPVALEPVEGDLLPAIGDTVLIHLSRPDGWFPHRVVGYYAWGDLSGSKHLYRVFVRVVDAEGYTNARPLDAIRRLGEEAAQPPAVAGAVPDEVAKDAARYRWLRQDESEFSSMTPAELDAAIDKAIAAAQKGGAA